MEEQLVAAFKTLYNSPPQSELGSKFHYLSPSNLNSTTNHLSTYRTTLNPWVIAEFPKEVGQLLAGLNASADRSALLRVMLLLGDNPYYDRSFV